MNSEYILKAQPQDFLTEGIQGVKERKNSIATTRFFLRSWNDTVDINR